MAAKIHRSFKYNEFPSGRGILKCAICGLPILNHKLGPPCPFMPDDARYKVKEVK